MKTERKLVLFIAVSMDGYIANENGEVDWLHQVEGEGDNGYAKFYETIDTVVMGRTTYDQVLTLAEEFPFSEKECYVFSSTTGKNDSNVKFVNEDVVSFVERLRYQNGKNIWLVGGAKLADQFIKERLVDEFIITVAPIILGKGIPLFQQENPEMKLELVSSTLYGQFMELHYKVENR